MQQFSTLPTVSAMPQALPRSPVRTLPSKMLEATDSASAAMPQALELASMLQALAFVALWWGVAWWLDRRKIYLKI